jgi:hypothetical protein
MGKRWTYLYTELKVQTSPTCAIWGYAILNNVKGNWMKFLKRAPKFSLCEGKAQWDEGDGRILLGDNRPRDGLSLTNQIEVCCSLDFNILHIIRIISIYTYIVDHMCTQFRLAPGLPERNYCVSRGESIDTCIFLYVLVNKFFLLLFIYFTVNYLVNLLTKTLLLSSIVRTSNISWTMKFLSLKITLKINVHKGKAVP